MVVIHELVWSGGVNLSMGTAFTSLRTILPGYPDTERRFYAQGQAQRELAQHQY